MAGSMWHHKVLATSALQNVPKGVIASCEHGRDSLLRCVYTGLGLMSEDLDIEFYFAIAISTMISWSFQVQEAVTGNDTQIAPTIFVRLELLSIGAKGREERHLGSHG